MKCLANEIIGGSENLPQNILRDEAKKMRPSLNRLPYFLHLKILLCSTKLKIKLASHKY